MYRRKVTVRAPRMAEHRCTKTGHRAIVSTPPSLIHIPHVHSIIKCDIIDVNAWSSFQEYYEACIPIDCTKIAVKDLSGISKSRFTVKYGNFLNRMSCTTRNTENNKKTNKLTTLDLLINLCSIMS